MLLGFIHRFNYLKEDVSFTDSHTLSCLSFYFLGPNCDHSKGTEQRHYLTQYNCGSDDGEWEGRKLWLPFLPLPGNASPCAVVSRRVLWSRVIYLTASRVIYLTHVDRPPAHASKCGSLTHVLVALLHYSWQTQGQPDDSAFPQRRWCHHDRVAR